MSIFKGIQRAKESLNQATQQQTHFSGNQKKSSFKKYKKLSSHVYLRGKMVPRNPRGIYVIDGETIFYKDDANATPALRDNLAVKPTKKKLASQTSGTKQDWQNFENPADLIKAAKDIQKAAGSRAKMLDELSKAQ